MIRIQRQRTKGWRMPEGAVYVGRPTIWGNPFHVPGNKAGRQDGLVYSLEMAYSVRTREDSVRAFRDYTAPGLNVEPLRDAAALACWCPLDQPCHADVLIELLQVAS